MLFVSRPSKSQNQMDPVSHVLLHNFLTLQVMPVRALRLLNKLALLAFRSIKLMDHANLAFHLKFPTLLPMNVLSLNNHASLDSKLTLLTEAALPVCNQKCQMKLPMSVSL